MRGAYGLKGSPGTKVASRGLEFCEGPAYLCDLDESAQ